MKLFLKFKFLAWTFCSALMSCSTSLREDEAALGYKLGRLDPAHWAEVKTDQVGNQLFQNKNWGSVIGLNSVCRRYQESSLETLSKSLTRPLDRQEILLQKKIEMDSREALETRVRGFMDGVEVEALFMSYRKNRCLFDFSLISREKIRPQEEEEYRAFLNDFHFEGSLP